MSTTAKVLELGDHLATAERSGDTDRLAQLVDENFRLVGPFGFVLDKQQWLERHRSGAFRINTLHWDEVSVADHGDIAIAIGKQTQQATYQGRPANGDFRVSQIFARTTGSWHLIGMHVSPAAEPQER
jgi:ketosteroid isomerase-like protein